MGNGLIFSPGPIPIKAKERILLSPCSQDPGMIQTDYPGPGFLILALKGGRCFCKCTGKRMGAFTFVPGSHHTNECRCKTYPDIRLWLTRG